jgi:hypothetical protein
MIRIERGDPTPEEIAAIVGVLTTLPASTSEPAPPEPSAWWRSGLPTRQGTWRESALPRLS